MNIAIAYTNHKGQRMEFGGSEDALHFFENKLRDVEWDYETAGSSVASFSKEPAEVELKVGIAADTEDEGLAWRDAIADLMEADVMARQPGSVSVNGWETPCYVVQREADNWWFSGRFFEVTLTLLLLTRTWNRTRTFRFDGNDQKSDGTPLDFPYDYAHDFSTAMNLERVIENDGIADADLVIRMYGPAESPSLQVGGNTYGAYVSVAAGGYLEIDTEQETVVLVGPYGDRSNVFGKRVKGAEGSGSFIFQKAAPGVIGISSDSGFSFDVDVVEHRSDPRWVSE